MPNSSVGFKFRSENIADPLEERLEPRDARGGEPPHLSGEDREDALNTERKRTNFSIPL
jgi:hypothetical protein